MSAIADESIANIRIVKSFANEAEECRKFNVGSLNVYKLGLKKAAWSSFFTFFNQFCLYGGMALIVYIAGLLYMKGQMKIGLLTSFLFYLLQILFNFWILTFVFTTAVVVVGSSSKIIEIMESEPGINTSGGIKIENEEEVQGRLELRDVRFTYPTKKDVEVLKGVSLEIDNKKNRVVALCGTSGCGKSSIIGLIERFYDPSAGEVLFNGVNIKEIEPRWYKENVAIVQQEPVLFSGSIRQNILYGLEWDDIDNDEITRRIDAACD